MSNNSINSNIPIEIAKGGTNAASFANANGTVYFDGTSLVSGATGSATQVWTSNGASAPTMQNAPTTSIMFQVLASDPASPVDGQVWYNTGSNAFKGQANSVTVTFTVT